ncbi:MAG: M23 family metallopeptidase [Oscillospiraceae bacterium]
MKIPRIISSLDYISDKKIAEAAPIDQTAKKRISKTLFYSIGGTCAAAAVLGVVILQVGHSDNGAVLNANASNTTSEKIYTSETSSDTFDDGRYYKIYYNDLPLNYNEDNSIKKFNSALKDSGNSYEIMLAYDSSELFGNNPWNESLETDELPIFKGNADIPRGYILAKETSLPKDCSVKTDSEMSLIQNAYQFLFSEWSDKMLFHDVYIDSYRNYSFSGEPVNHVKYHKNSENLFEALLYHNFTSIEFFSQDDEIYIRQYNQLDDLIAVGFYPTITAKDALAKLLSGNYYTTVPAGYLSDSVTEKKVEFTELVYRTNSDGYTMPYYRFVLKLDNHNFDDEFLKKGLNNYGAYYVPAISPEYLSTDDRSASSAVQEWLKQPHSSPLENFGVLEDRTGRYRFIPADYGTKVMAIEDGEVIFVGYEQWHKDILGYTIVIRHSGGIYTLYHHLDKDLGFEVSVGDTVKAGQCIAYVGSSGNTSDSGLGFSCTDEEPNFD